MLTDIRDRTFSSQILDPLELNTDIFPELVEPGTQIGKVTASAAAALGIEAGITVIASGHDTQFAILGSGASVNQPVLSSGTWEILMVRANSEALRLPSRESGVTIEWDVKPGMVNIGVQWVASGVLEWVSRLLYPEGNETSRYLTMMGEADSIPAGSNGLIMIPELFPGGFSGKPGGLIGFTHETTRAHIYRATLEALSYYCCYGLKKLEQIVNYQANDLICVGGGSKNSLWNQIRANVLGIPVKALEVKETTALGAALTAFTGMGIYSNMEEAVAAVKSGYKLIYPGEDSDKYIGLYSNFIKKVF